LVFKRKKQIAKYKCKHYKFFYLVLKIFKEGAYLKFKWIFHKALDLFYFGSEIMLGSVPGTIQY